MVKTITKSLISCCIVLGFILCSNVLAGEITEVELIDGSVIFGEITSFKDGCYTMRSKSVGVIKINESKIRSISMKNKGARKEDVSITFSDDELHGLQELMMQDQQIMNLIFSLQNDPEIQMLLQDQVIMNAVSTGDINALMSDPRFIKIFENATIQEIQRKAIKK